MEAGLTKNNMALLMLMMVSLIFPGLAALQYDSFATTECLKNPPKALYEGGVLTNSEFNEGLEGWNQFGSAKLGVGKAQSGNNTFIKAEARTHSFDSFSQTVNLVNASNYMFSGWVQVNKGSAAVKGVMKTEKNEFTLLGSVKATSGCWSFLKGGLTADYTTSAVLYFESDDTSVEIWGDSISLQPFTKDQWKAMRKQNVEKFRKGRVQIRVINIKGEPVRSANISIVQLSKTFPVGNAINGYILESAAYRTWFFSRFTVTTFENEMKWYSTESTQGVVDYSVADKMLDLVTQYNVSVRGHAIHWESPDVQLSWVKALPPDQLKTAVDNRVKSFVNHFCGKVIAYDVVNEDLHYDFYKSRLGRNVTTEIYRNVSNLDCGNTLLFLNDFNTIDEPGDGLATPDRYIKRIKEIQSSPGFTANMAIGLEAHFSTPNVPFIKASLDKLGDLNVPIWLTELDVDPKAPLRAQYLREIMEEAYSYPKVNGIVMWFSMNALGQCYRSCLTDKNFNNLDTGDVVDELLAEWGKTKLVAKTNAHGLFNTSLFHGDYQVTVNNPTTKSTATQQFKVAPVDTNAKCRRPLIVEVSV